MCSVGLRRLEYPDQIFHIVGWLVLGVYDVMIAIIRRGCKKIGRCKAWPSQLVSIGLGNEERLQANGIPLKRRRLLQLLDAFGEPHFWVLEIVSKVSHPLWIEEHNGLVRAECPLDC